MKQIIVHADDFGSSSHFNNAILKAYSEGFLTSTAILVNGKAFKSGAKLVKEKYSNIGMGVHLNLIEGKSSLSNESKFVNFYKNGFYNLNFIKILVFSFNKKFMAQVEKEIRYQIETAKKELKIDHLNSHQHCTSIPKVFELCCKLAKEYEIKNIRIPNEKIIFSKDLSKYFKISFHLNVLKFLILKIFCHFNKKSAKKFKINFPDNFCGILYTGFMDRSVIKKTINKTKENEILEILLHPCDLSGSCVDEFMEDSRDYAVDYNRIDELKVLLDKELQNFITLNSNLRSFKDFKSSNPSLKITPKNTETIQLRKKLNIFIVFDETTFFHPVLLEKLFGEIENVSWVGALRVTLPNGGDLQNYLIKNIFNLGVKSFLTLFFKTLVLKIIGIMPRFIKGNFSSSVKSTLKRHKIPFVSGKKIDEKMITFIRSKNPDVILSSNSLIFNEEVLKIPKICSINRHSSPLPSYGGILPVFRAIQFKESFCGASVHLMDQGIDTGKVLSRKFLPIYKKDSVFKLYKMLFVLSFVAIEEAIKKIINNQLEDELKSETNVKKSYFSYPTQRDWNDFKKNGGSFT